MPVTSTLVPVILCGGTGSAYTMSIPQECSMLEQLCSQIMQMHKSGQLQSRLELWAWILNHLNIKRFAEIGVWKGGFSEYILKNVSCIESYTMIDPWMSLPDWNKPLNRTKDFESVLRTVIERTAFAKEKLNILRGTTSSVSAMLKDEDLDMVYIDGDHTLRGIVIDMIRLLPKVKENGFIGGDDFTATPWQHSIEYEPTLVCPFAVYFSEAMSLPIAAIGQNQFLLRKSSDSGFSFTDTFSQYTDISLNKLPVRYGKLGSQ